MEEISCWFQESVSSGFLCFDKIFETPSASNTLPLKLEICSGAGEWACAQATKDAGNANWATLELRHDRVYSTFSRAILGGVSNLCMLSGDAMTILPNRISTESVSALFVNHPGKQFVLCIFVLQGITRSIFCFIQSRLNKQGKRKRKVHICSMRISLAKQYEY